MKTMNLKKSLREGFTLIEILIVVAIIAILASVVLVGLGPTQQAGRDARRVSDLHEVQNGLELYYNKCGYYPGAGACAGTPLGTANDGGATFATYYGGMAAALVASNIGVSSAPVDPSNNGTHYYSYATTNLSGGTTYALMANMENPSSTVFNGYSAPQGTWGSGDTGVSGGGGTNGLTAAICGKSGNYCISL